MEEAATPTEATSTSPNPLRRFAHPISIPLALLWFVLLAVGFSDTGTSYAARLFFRLGCAGFMSIWAIRGMRSVASSVSNRRDASVPPRPFRYFAFEPTLLLLSFLYVDSGIPRWARFEFSESALEAHVQSILDGRFVLEHTENEGPAQSSSDLPDYTNRWRSSARAWDTRSRIVGLYEIVRTHWMKSGEIVLETSKGSTGLVYTTAPSVARFYELGWRFRWHPLSGPWWRYEEDL